MITSLSETGFPAGWTVDDLRRHLGGIPARRIRVWPPPGLATVQHVIEIRDREGRLCELVDGTLVEKTMGWYESLVAVLIVTHLHSFVRKHRLGQVLGADGTLRIFPHMVRIPDGCFISWERLPKGSRQQRRRPVPSLAPDLAVEVLSKGNTKKEMARKLRDYFEAGVRLVWYIDVESRTAIMYSAVDQPVEIDEDGELDGGDVLPGFSLSLRELFAEADLEGPN